MDAILNDVYIQWLIGDKGLWHLCSIIGIASSVISLFLHGAHQAHLDGNNEISMVRFESNFILRSYQYLLDENEFNASICLHLKSILDGNSPIYR